MVSEVGAREVEVPDIGAPGVLGDLALPEGASGVVVFAHGSGSGRTSPRNRLVALELRRAGLATLLLDLLTAQEQEEDELGAEHRFDISLLTERLVAAVDWLGRQPVTSRLPVGCYGASTGAAAALGAAALRPSGVAAVVSRGGRTDLVTPDLLARVHAPVLLVVGSLDPEVLELNRETFQTLHSERELAIVKGASHLFEEPGALDEVARLTTRWFLRTLREGAHPEVYR